MSEYPDLMTKITALCKRRGFVYPNSQIYGGLSNAYDYGPLGVEMLRNIKDQWWKIFVHQRENIYGIDGAIISNPRVWEASGHVANFADALIDCRRCNLRLRVDHFIEEETGEKVEGRSLEELAEIIESKGLTCPSCGSKDFTPPRKFNTLFRSELGSLEEGGLEVYLRGETAQNMFLDYKAVVDSFSPKLPFGLAQIGKAFRNEVTLGNFIFRTFEFEQMEIEYFLEPDQWEAAFEQWKQDMWSWLTALGVREEKIRWRRHSEEELSHYSRRTEDVEYDFPFGGFQELYGLAYRTDFDLSNHARYSGQDLSYRREDGSELIPHVVEPTFGVSRTLLVLLLEAYCEDEVKGSRRVYLKLDPRIAPYKVAVFPLVSNNEDLVNKAREVFGELSGQFHTAWDDHGNVGKRYRRQDEIGTPWCITVDYQTLEDGTVTVRDRDTMEQERISVNDLSTHLHARLASLF